VVVIAEDASGFVSQENGLAEQIDVGIALVLVLGEDNLARLGVGGVFESWEQILSSS